MARVYPFRAWRYNPAVVRLADVVTQPGDKISPAMQQAYYRRSSFNLVRIILGLPELFDAEKGESVYARAARDFRAWREQGVLIQDKEPCVFAYSQRFTVPGSLTVKERRGFIALGKLYEYGEQVVFRHEKALPQPQSGRLNLLKATRGDFGQILMLYSDPAGTVNNLLFNGGPADTEVSDEFGTLHRLTRINDPAAIRLLVAAMDDKKLIVADGQQGYETALDYSRSYAVEYASKLPAGGDGRGEFSAIQLTEPSFPESAAMMTFVNMDSEGLVILPAHRVVHGLPDFDPAAFARAAREFFTVEPLARPGAEPYPDPEPYDEPYIEPCIGALEREKGPAFVSVTRAGAFLLRAKPESLAAALAGVPERQRQFELTQIHSLVLERILGVNAEKAADGTHLRCLRDAGEAVEQVKRGQADIAFLTKPVTLNQLREMAFAGHVMPQKSIEFYPKLLSGLAIYALD